MKSCQSPSYEPPTQRTVRGLELQGQLLCNGLRRSTPWAFKTQKERLNPKGIGKQSLFVSENKPASVPTADTPAFKNDLYPGLLGLALIFSPAGVFVV